MVFQSFADIYFILKRSFQQSEKWQKQFAEFELSVIRVHVRNM